MPSVVDKPSPEPKIRVLLVEDNPLDARVMEVMFEQVEGRPFDLQWVTSLADGIQQLAPGNIDLVLLDLTLPDSLGLDTFNRLHDAAGDLPVIVLSGVQDSTLAVETVQKGAQDYLVKGHVDAHLLERAIRYAVERQKTAQQLARFTHELAAKNEQMEGELALAREIQMAYLPQQALAFPEDVPEEKIALRLYHRYEPTEALGGDFFNILSLSDSQAGVLICDVIGHGAQAALVTGVLRGLVEELKDLATDPGQFLTAMNQGLMGVLRAPLAPSLTTAFYLTCDVSTGVAQYATAGHPSPLLIRRTTNSVSPLPFDPQKRGPALGLIDNAVYHCASEGLCERDLVMMFTDGLYEVQADDQQRDSDDWLVDAVQRRIERSAPELFDELLTEAHGRCDETELADDVCIVGVEVIRLGSGGKAT